MYNLNQELNNKLGKRQKDNIYIPIHRFMINKKYQLKDSVYTIFWQEVNQGINKPSVFCFVWFDSLRPLNNLSVMRDGSSLV